MLARKYQLLEGTPPIAADLIDKLCVLEPSARLGGAWSVEADTTDPSKLSGIEPRLLGHAALRAHPFFEGLPATDLHLFPVPQPTAEEIEMNELVRSECLNQHMLVPILRLRTEDPGVESRARQVRKIGTEGIDAVFGATEADRTAAVASWSDDFKLVRAPPAISRNPLFAEQATARLIAPVLHRTHGRCRRWHSRRANATC